MKLEFSPYMGVGPLTFGLTRQEVHQILGEPDGETPESVDLEVTDIGEALEGEDETTSGGDFDEGSENETEDGANREFFSSQFLFVEYDEEDKLEAVEIMAPAELTYGSLKLLETPYNQLVKHFESQDHDLNIDALGFTSKKFGICVYYVSAVDFSDQAVDQIKVFKKDYTGELYP